MVKFCQVNRFTMNICTVYIHIYIIYEYDSDIYDGSSDGYIMVYGWVYKAF